MDAAVWLIKPVVRHHQAELRRHATSGAKADRPQRRSGRRPGSPRERLGWALVEIGLRLALPNGERRPSEIAT
jgi:hypothetical protein